MIYNVISLVKIKPVKRHNVHFFTKSARSIKLLMTIIFVFL